MSRQYSQHHSHIIPKQSSYIQMCPQVLIAEVPLDLDLAGVELEDLCETLCGIMSIRRTILETSMYEYHSGQDQTLPEREDGGTLLPAISADDVRPRRLYLPILMLPHIP